MATRPKRTAIAGSERVPVAGARAIGAAPDAERLEVTVRVRRKAPLAAAAHAAESDRLPAQRKPMSRAAFAAQHGAAAADLDKVAAFARAHDLAVIESSAARRSVVLSGTVKSMSEAFGVTLKQYEHDDGTYRGRTGPVHVPEELSGIVEAVLGLDDRPQAKPHFQRRKSSDDAGGVAAPHKVLTAFTPLELARLYGFPQGLDGSGECIAIIELGGGYRPADLKAYFESLGLEEPLVKTVRVDGGRNHPSTADSADGEVMLDIEVAGAIAPKARIAVYFAPNTDQGFLDAITTAVHDDINKPSVVSISWGAPESEWTAQSMTQYDQAFEAAAAMGVTICCAAGDKGSSDGVTDGKPHVDFPASSPHVLGCGGTRLTASATTISSEVVWNAAADSATGGGVSGFFALPAWQSSAHVPSIAGSSGTSGRGVPDVAGVADPATGYRVRVDGQDLVFGGTSAVAPLWAGLIARVNQKLGAPVGFLNPLLYGSLSGKALFRDITNGSNGAYEARRGWDPCTGWGTPHGAKLLSALEGPG